MNQEECTLPELPVAATHGVCTRDRLMPRRCAGSSGRRVGEMLELWDGSHLKHKQRKWV